MFSGTTAPSTPVAGQLFYDTDDKLIYVYDGATWRLIGDANLTNLGLLPKAGGAGNPMSGALYMGTQQVKGMANPTTSTDGVNVSYADATYLKLAGGTLTGAVVMGANKITSSRSSPNDATELIRKDYADLMLTKSGGTMSGAIAMGANAITGLPTQTDGTDGANAASCSYLRGKLDTSTGHDHDGSDSKRVLMTNLDATGYVPTVVTRVGSPTLTTSFTDIVEATIAIPITTNKIYGQFNCNLVFNNSGGDAAVIQCDLRILNAANATQAEYTNITYSILEAGGYENFTLSFAYAWVPGAVGNETFTVQLKATGGITRSMSNAVLWCTTF
jgi:hypothetical protein